MTINITDGILTHHDPRENRVSTFRILPDGGMNVRVKNPGSINLDELSYADRIALARFLLTGAAFGPKYTLDSFTAGIGGPNRDHDRQNYIDSFGTAWRDGDPLVARELQTWIDHQDSTDVDGVWHERIEAYYADRGY